MMRKKILMLMMFLIVCSGCQTIQEDPAAELLAAQITFEKTVRSLTILRSEGKFTRSEANHISELMYSCQEMLIRWERIVFEEKRRPEAADFRDPFNVLIDELMSYLDEE
jgi:hypothetical protein